MKLLEWALKTIVGAEYTIKLSLTKTNAKDYQTLMK
jgi:hypothetical protein